MKTLNTSRKVNLGVTVVSSLDHHYRLFRLRLSDSVPVIYTCMNRENFQMKISMNMKIAVRVKFGAQNLLK